METPGQVFACTSGANLNATLTCLGDEGPNRTRPAKGAPASTIWWENDARCGEVVLDGTGKSKLPCQYAGDCAYTAPLRAQTASKGVAEACAPIPCRQSDAAIKARCDGLAAALSARRRHPAHQSPPTALCQQVDKCPLVRRICSRQQGAAAESSRRRISSG
eukprot:COSAG01_NODE_1476_length_10188_cov_16.029537_3_plen_162_part_00